MSAKYRAKAGLPARTVVRGRSCGYGSGDVVHADHGEVDVESLSLDAGDDGEGHRFSKSTPAKPGRARLWSQCHPSRSDRFWPGRCRSWYLSNGVDGPLGRTTTKGSRAGEGRFMPLTATDLLAMTRDELDELFRRADAGPIPSGEGHGTAIFAPDRSVSDVAAKLAHLIAWKGKVFDPERGELRNKIGPTGALAIRAKVYHGESWFDRAPSIVLDYSDTSLVAHWIRDEIRLVAPDLYLGIVYWDHDRILHFSLQFDPGSDPV